MQLRDEKDSIMYPGQWGFFSGKINPGEDPSHTAKREMYEELKIHLKNLIFVDVLLDKKNQNRHYLYKVYLKYFPKIVLQEGIEYGLFSKIDFFKGFKNSQVLKRKCSLAKTEVMKRFFNLCFFRDY